jgi:hypothetical protein
MTVDCRRRNASDLRLMMRYRVVADGKDITSDTFFVDARRRRVGVFLRNEQGRHFVILDGSSRHGEMAVSFLHPRRVRLIKI